MVVVSPSEFISLSPIEVEMRSLKTLPKAHLHLHTEGAMRPSTLDELCGHYGIPRPIDTRGKHFDNFGGFVATYFAACECIRTRDDLARLILEVAEDAAEQGVWWLEAALDTLRYSRLRPDGPTRLFESQHEGWLFVMEATQVASQATGVGISFVSAIDRSAPVEQAFERAEVTAALVKAEEHLIQSGMASLAGRYPGMVAVGLHGNEEGFPPEPFADAFRVATNDTGLLSTPHAGEIAPAPGQGPASVVGALDALQADRIMHGVLAIEAPDVVERLARERICLDVCPSSNLLLNVFPSAKEHPLPALLDAGVPCSIGSDDPLLFGPSLLDEFELCRHVMGFDDERLAALARTSFEFSGAPNAVKEAGIAGVEAWLQS